MGYASRYAGIYTVHLDDHYWVRLRHLRTREAREIGELNGLSGSERGLAGLTAAIVEWNLDDDEGNILPVSPEVIDEMAVAHSVKLFEAFNAEEGGSKDAGFPAAAGAGDQDRGEPAA
jgi:hypothetical protein